MDVDITARDNISANYSTSLFLIRGDNSLSEFIYCVFLQCFFSSLN